MIYMSDVVVVAPDRTKQLLTGALILAVVIAICILVYAMTRPPKNMTAEETTAALQNIQNIPGMSVNSGAIVNTGMNMNQ